MPDESPVFGRVADIEEYDLEPIRITLIGYRLDKTEVAREFRFRPVQPAGATLDIVKAMDGAGRVPTSLVMEYLDESLLADERVDWDLFLRDPEVMIEQTVLAQLYQHLTEMYTGRPTPPPFVSSGGGSRTGGGSQGARGGRGSGSTTARPRKKTSPKR